MSGVSVVMIACLFFGFASVLMGGRGWLTFAVTSSVPVNVSALTDFYFWFFVNAVPVLKITETLRWSVSLQYESAAVGWMLLLFKFTVIEPLIAGVHLVRQARCAGHGTRAGVTVQGACRRRIR